MDQYITDLQIRMLLLTLKQYPTLSPHCLCRATWEPQIWNKFSISVQIKLTWTKSSFCTNNFTVPKKSRYSFSSCFRASSCPVQKVFGWHLFSLLLLVIFKRDCSKLNCKLHHWSSASQLNFKELWAHTTIWLDWLRIQFWAGLCSTDVMILWFYDNLMYYMIMIIWWKYDVVVLTCEGESTAGLPPPSPPLSLAAGRCWSDPAMLL